MKPLALAPLALLFVPVDGPRYAPASGARLTKTFTESTDMTLDSAVMTMNGQDREEELELTIENKRRVKVTDTYDRVADGKVAKLTRSYDDISGTIEFEADQGDHVQVGEFEGASGLAGQEVVFERDSDGVLEKRYAEDSDGDAEWLEELTLDTDLASWLPTASVDEGDTWSIPAAALNALLEPGNTPRCDMENIGGEDESEALLFGTFFSLQEICSDASGDIEAQWKSTREEDGVKLAVIELELDVEFERDVLDIMGDIGHGIGEDQVDAMTQAQATGALEGKGTLIWNLSTGLPQSLELEGDVSIALSIDIEEGGMEMHMQLEMSGTTTLALETETP